MRQDLGQGLKDALGPQNDYDDNIYGASFGKKLFNLQHSYFWLI